LFFFFFLILDWGYQPERVQAGAYFFIYFLSRLIPIVFFFYFGLGLST